MAYRMGIDLPRTYRQEEVWQKVTRMVPNFIGFRADEAGTFFVGVTVAAAPGASEVTLILEDNSEARVHFVPGHDKRYADAPYHIYGV